MFFDSSKCNKFHEIIILSLGQGVGNYKFPIRSIILETMSNIMQQLGH